MREVKSAFIVAALKDDLRLGRLVPGQRLVEAELSARFAAGRGAVREALKHLAAEGLAIIEPNRGASIRRLSETDLAHIYDVRAQLEGLAARRTAQRGDNGSVAALWEEMQAAEARRDIRAYIELNSRFHDLLIALADNPFLTEAAARLRTPIMRFQFSVLMDPDALRQSHREHGEIVAAILRRDAEAAETAMRRHITSSRRHVLAEQG